MCQDGYVVPIYRAIFQLLLETGRCLMIAKDRKSKEPHTFGESAYKCSKDGGHLASFKDCPEIVRFAAELQDFYFYTEEMFWIGDVIPPKDTANKSSRNFHEKATVNS